MNELSKAAAALGAIGGKSTSPAKQQASRENGRKHTKRIRCDQCEALMINGVFCHETGCPNTHSRWDSESESWVKQRKCFECGCTVDADEPCCQSE